jgi:nitrite reductase (NADH) large subunit
MSAMRLVIIGNGVAAINTAQAVLKNMPDTDIAVYSEEPYLYYPRPKLWEFLPGKLTLEQLYFHPAEWYEDRGINVHLGTPVAEIRPADESVVLHDGQAVSYDRLLLANGGIPFIPPIENVAYEGVFTLRTVEDALAIRAYAGEVSAAVVIGGGLLGLESARGLKELGLEVTVIEVAPWLLPRQLDRDGAAVLNRTFEDMGIKTVTGSICQAIEGEGRVAGIRLKDGRHISGELVLVSAGIRSNTTLASAAGLVVNRGVVVNEHLQTSDPLIYAAGDVIEFQETSYGIIPAAVEQARIAGDNLSDQTDVVYKGTISSNTLKVVGISLTTVGTFSAPDDSYQEYRVSDPARGVYKKIVVKDNKLVGAILLGFPQEMARITKLVRQEKPLEGPVEDLLQMD